MQKKAKVQLKDISLLFETSWEVCNKIGGIYTVLSTKARELHEQFGDRLVFIGPDVWTEENPSPVFVERKTLLKSVATKMALPMDLKIRVGRWDIPGSPLVVLVKFDGVFSRLPDIYGEMWEKYGVDSLHAYGDYDEGCAFAVASAIVMENLTLWLKADPEGVIGHFNEWTTGMGLLYLKAHLPQAATVFTAHATCIGRSICGNGKPLYDYFERYNGDQMARELNMESKHSLEKAAAHQADCFTAVSEITARECEQLLDIRPQVVTPNGFEPDFVPCGAKYASLREKARKRVLKVASLLKQKDFDDDTLIVATSGRNEYRNKGLDLFLDAMATLNSLPGRPARQVLALVLVPAWVKEPSADLVFDMKYKGEVIPSPDYLTHRLNNEGTDSVAVRVAALEGQGALSDVSVIYVPVYLDGHDGIVDISYYDFLPGVDLTVFPSYYEPWGYTPLESVAFGIPTVTTDKSGFGQWIEGITSSVTGDLFGCGVAVVPRTDSNYSEACRGIAGLVKEYSAASAPEVACARENATATSRKADWKFFLSHYDDAFKTALTRRDGRMA